MFCFMFLKCNSSHSLMSLFWFSLIMNKDVTHSVRNMGKVAVTWECLVTMETHFQNKIVLVFRLNWTNRLSFLVPLSKVYLD